MRMPANAGSAAAGPQTRSAVTSTTLRSSESSLPSMNHDCLYETFNDYEIKYHFFCGTGSKLPKYFIMSCFSWEIITFFVSCFLKAGGSERCIFILPPKGFPRFFSSSLRYKFAASLASRSACNLSAVFYFLFKVT